MKLQELGAQRQTQQIARVLENQGQKIDFDLLGPRRTRGMLVRVQGLLSEHRNSKSFHKSQTNSAYLNLVMMEQALTARLHEAGEVAAAPGTMSAGGVAPAANPAQMGMQIAQRKKQLQDQLRAAQEQVRAIQKQMSQPTLGMAESRRSISESEVQQAQVVLAAQDMVDQIQKMMEQISEMQFKDMPALVNSIRNDMGIEQATKYQADATAALTTLLGAVQSGKTQLEAAQAVLTGQVPIVPGTDTGAMPAPGADLGTDAGADIDADLDIDATLPTDDGEEEVDIGANLGRERR